MISILRAGTIIRNSLRRNSLNKTFRGIALLLAIFAIVAPRIADAHPMGNFSINHYAGISVEPGFIEVRYLIDMAEIPTYQEILNSGITPKEGDPGLPAYLEKKAEALAGGLTLRVNGQILPLQAISESVIFPEGAGGLPTMKVGFVYRAALGNFSSATLNAVEYSDANFAGHAGWKEIVVKAQHGVDLSVSPTLTADRSAQLSNYPTDLLSSPPQDLQAGFHFSESLPAESNTTASVKVRPVEASPAVSTFGDNKAKQDLSSKPARANVHSQAAPPHTSAVMQTSAAKSSPSERASSIPPPLKANQQQTPRNKFTELVSTRNMSFWFLFTAAFIAAGLGAFHALEPGHGKTIVAAYLVGSRGTARHAVFLGLIVTAAHTGGVYLLGAITLYASKYIVPEQLYPWLGVISGVTIAVLASYMMIRAWSGESGEHSYEPGVAHSHWYTSFGANRAEQNENARSATDSGELSDQPAKKVSLTQLLTLGITGGIVPCPAALVVLLGAFSLHRIGFGLFLIVAFSLGLAAVLIAIGLLMVYARQFIARWKSDGSMVKRWLPVASSGFMFILGLGIAGQALITTGIGASFFAQAKMPSILGVLLLGLFLGMRHSTDPDHVVAVSTIASREKSVGQGALIGMLWGVGHTLTIFVVGSAIILFGLVIPPRVGLSMEFSVALMLILLGVLNLTGALRWITARFSPQFTNQNQTQQSGNLRTAANAPGENALDRLISRYGSFQVFRPLFIGLVHGLAGSAAVALLVLSTIRSPLWAIAYLLIFGIGTIIGMMLMTSAMAIPVACTGKHFADAGKYLSPISGIVSTGFGLFLVYQIGFVDGLFRAAVHWTPQ